MSIEIRAKVGRFPKVNPTPALAAKPWRALVYKFDTDQDTMPHEQAARGRHEWFYSLPEALQGVQVMRRDLERELMDEVHASRASRRAQRCIECGDIVPDGKAHWKFNEGPCMISPAEQIDPDTAEETYTMEATA